MQVKDLIEMLGSNYNQTEELVVLFYSKDEFAFDKDLTDENWAKVVTAVERGGLDSADQVLSETISEMVGEYSEDDSEDSDD